MEATSSGPGLLDFNLAAHGVWLVALLALATLALFWAFDFVSDLRRRRRDAQPEVGGATGDAGSPPEIAALHPLRDAASPGVLGRTWSEGRANPPRAR